MHCNVNVDSVDSTTRTGASNTFFMGYPGAGDSEPPIPCKSRAPHCPLADWSKVGTP
jgi:hypothetical protein